MEKDSRYKLEGGFQTSSLTHDRISPFIEFDYCASVDYVISEIQNYVA